MIEMSVIDRLYEWYYGVREREQAKWLVVVGWLKCDFLQLRGLLLACTVTKYHCILILTIYEETHFHVHLH